jgi:hypothetical protein
MPKFPWLGKRAGTAPCAKGQCLLQGLLRDIAVDPLLERAKKLLQKLAR